VPLVLNLPDPLMSALEVEALNAAVPVEEHAEALLHLALVLLDGYDFPVLPEAAARFLVDRSFVTAGDVAAAFDESIKPLLDDEDERRRAARLAQDPEARAALVESLRGCCADLRHTVREPVETYPGVAPSPIVDDFLRLKREDLQLEEQREARRWAAR
jgi:hypothetical protein